MPTLNHLQYQTAAGITVRRAGSQQDYHTAIDQLVDRLDQHQGVLLASSFEYPGRYTRWDLGFSNPPLEISARGLEMTLRSLNRRGQVLLPEIHHALLGAGELASLEHDAHAIRLTVCNRGEPASEEMRSRQPSVFSVLRRLVEVFRSAQDPYLGLYGAFGYDLGFQFEDVTRRHVRAADSRDLLLYLPDEILVADHRTESAIMLRYDFVCRGWGSEVRNETTGGFRRTGETQPFVPASQVQRSGDHQPGEYAASVELALEQFRQGNLFEVVPGQVFYEPCKDRPSAVFRRLKKSNPAPYGALINLGKQEYLVAASPEMFVRVDGEQIETCPISGTIRRGADAIEDAQQIRTLLNSAKDESELSMCTDVDRNDKARVCVPGSVQVVGRRQIEMYSRLIHTVDHVTGTLREPFDALDGFLAHTWAVTVTGAPKHGAMQFIENHEKSPRDWYGGALGQIGFNGNLNTGLTLRTIRIKDGVAQVRAGATLLIDSDPAAEEAETRLKASALLEAIRGTSSLQAAQAATASLLGNLALLGRGLHLLMVDHQDSFVHNLAAYFRQCGMTVTTLRPAQARQLLVSREAAATPIDLVVLSPGPGRPADFDMAATLSLCMQQRLPVFGVCLGLQGMVEYFGGELGLLEHPQHGKPSVIETGPGCLFEGLPRRFTAGRYHSLHGVRIPDCLRVTATDAQGTVMAVEHVNLPLWAVQFHPESIMTLDQQVGLRLVGNVVEYVAGQSLQARTG
ncbi:MAG: hypothetical protein RLZZ385_532 [Pseudomonadota bacterium]|jgi:anthranilate synthase